MEDAAATLHEDLRALVGQTIADRYRVDRLIGIGGMGAVFRGHHLGLKRDVAIKVLHPDLTRDQQISARFDREAHSASRLDHPNCLQVTDYGSTSDGMKFMVMQLLEGRELGEIFTQALSPERAVDLMLQIFRGLEHAHDHGVVHRDLKPENVFVTTDHEGAENLKLVDFGIAKIMSGDEAQENMTKMGIVFGTPQYMSPEQATGMAIDARTDLYSAGIIFHQMLCGKPPFESDDPVALVRMQVSAAPPALPAYTPRHLKEFISNLLAKEREKRFPDAKAAREALEFIRNEIGDQSPTGAPMARRFTNSMQSQGSMPERISEDPERGKQILWSAAAGIVVIVIGLGFLAYSNSVDEDEAPEAMPVAHGSARPGDGPATTQAEPSPDGPSAQQLAEIDKLLLAKNTEAAQKLVQPLRDEYPENVQLLWRQGRVLALQRKKRSQALASYGDAIERDETLLDDKDFYAELMELLKDPKLRDEALDLALRKMGSHGHKFLLELVNREKRALDHHNRHRALEELGTNPENEPLINLKLNTALDFWQAQQSLTPCQAYDSALRAVETRPDGYFTNAVEKAPLPKPIEGETADSNDAKVCKTISTRRDALLPTLQELAALEASDTDGEDPPGGAPKSGQGKSGQGKSGQGKSGQGKGKAQSSRTKSTKPPAPRSNKCNRFGAPLLYKDCR